MAKKQPLNSGQRWSKSDESTLKKRAKGNTPTPLIAHELGRSEDAVRSKAQDLDVSLKPTSKSPYDRRKK